MKFEIEMEKVPPMNLDKPSDELREFLRQLHGVLLFFCSNFTFPVNDHLTAYLRWGSLSVLSVEDFRIRPMEIQGKQQTKVVSDDEKEGWLLDDEDCIPYDEERTESSVVMDDDQPGNWCVLRLVCPFEIVIRGSSSCQVTLFSNDFEDETAEEVFRQVVVGTKRCCLRTPMFSHKLQELIRVVES
jgi:hypothetical protein